MAFHFISAYGCFERVNFGPFMKTLTGKTITPEIFGGEIVHGVVYIAR